MACTAAKPKPKNVFVVERLAWHYFWDDSGVARPICHSGEEQGGVPLTAYAVREHAEARRAELEREARADANPFLFAHGDPEYLSSKSEAAFKKAVRKIGLEPPTASASEHEGCWYHWWQNTEPGMTDGQREAMWALLDKAAFYRVSECELED